MWRLGLAFCTLAVLSPNSTALSPDSTDGTIEVQKSIIARVAPEYVSFNFDSSQYRSLPMNNSALRILASALSPAHLRVGGTQADYDVFAVSGFENFDCSNPPHPMTSYRCKTVTASEVDALIDFVTATNLTLVYGLNDLFGRPTKTKPEHPLCSSTSCPARNQSNIEALFRYLRGKHPNAPIYAFELGNELNSCLNGTVGAQTQAMDFGALQKLIQSYWQSPSSPPFLVGPDTHSAAEYQSKGLEWFKTFIQTAQTQGFNSPKAFTFHMYSLGDGPKLDPANLDASFLNPNALNKAGQGADALRQLQGDLQTQGAPFTLWAGETAAANNGGQSGVTDTFIDGFWYLDQLGSLAQRNVSVFQRQVFLSTKGYPLVEYSLSSTEPDGNLTLQPLPDYWLALLFSKLMGQRVLMAKSSLGTVRVYAHCAKSGGGKVSLAFLNLARTPTTMKLNGLGEDWKLWILQAGKMLPGAVNQLQSKQVLLNGQLLSFDGKRIPDLPAKEGSGDLELPGLSYGLVILPNAQMTECA